MADLKSDFVLQVDGLKFTFEKKAIFADISFALRKGELMYIAGQNGAGKSSLLKTLLRLHESGKVEGEVRVAGRLLNSYSQAELARRISYVPQAGGWIPPFTAAHFAELSYFSRRNERGAAKDGEAGPPAGKRDSLKKAAEKAVEKALELAGISGFADRPLRTLSGGERQQAYVAAALAQGAEIMLLDEPSAFLDPKRAAGMNELLVRLNREEKLTMICVTHDLNQMLASGATALLLCAGRQRYCGPSSGLADGEILNRVFMHNFTMLAHPKTGKPALLY